MYNNDRRIIINNLVFWILILGFCSYPLHLVPWVLDFPSCTLFLVPLYFAFFYFFSLTSPSLSINRQATASQILVTTLPVSAQFQHQYYMLV